MRCKYCDVEVTQYPVSGICPCCGGRLPPKPTPQLVHIPVYIPVQQPVYMPGAITCPSCRSMYVTTVKRGFSWGLAILGCFFFPVFGLLLGFCGSKKPRLQCTQCRRKWKHR